MVVQHNMTAANANRMLGNIVTQQSKSTEKLSSGYRINRAGDDAAGLAISEKMRGQIRGLNQASTNAQDGISLIQTAEGALSESQSILQRMRELSVQAANGTETDDDRAEIQKEVNQLTSELNRIGNTTEFNTMSLLKGDTTTAATKTSDVATLKEAEVAELVGSVGNFQVKEESKVAEASTTTLIGASSSTTGKATNISVRKQGVEAEKATGDVLGVQFEATTGGTSLNGTKVVIKAATAAAKEGIVHNTADKTLTISLTEDTINTLNTVSDLNSKIGEFLKSDSKAGTTSTAGKILIDDASVTKAAIGTIKTKVPEGVDSSVNVSEALKALVKDTTRSETVALSGGTTATQGKYTFKLEKAFSEKDDTITVAGYTFTAIAASDTAPTAGDDTFRLGTATTTKDLKTQADDIALQLTKKIENDASLATGSFTVTASTDGTITIQENAAAAGKVNLDSTVTTSGAGGDEELTITDELGQNLQIKLEKNDSDALAVEYAPPTGTASTGTLNIKLATTTASKNTAELIQTAIRGATVSDGTNLSKINVTATNDWDEKAVGATLNKAWSTMTGGTKEVKGQYSFNLSNKMAAGEELTIGGQTFKAVESGADASKGEFNVGTTTSDQLNNLQNAMNKNEEFSKYDISFTGSIVTLTEKNASGVDLNDNGMAVKATGVQGEFSVDVADVLTDGASIDIDGEKIEVSSKNAHVGYDNGTAIKETATAKDQTQAIADAVNKNENLSAKYTASVGDDGKLLLTQKYADANAPAVTATASAKGDLDITFQVGANSNQSMTISIQDNRALALGVSGDGSSKTVMAENGNVASYTEVKGVNDGSDNENIEFALDVSSYDKATAAVSVIDDALSSISSQRATLGAYQNRLEHTISNLDNTSENLQTAESNIRDVDMASEMVDYSKNNILQQAAQSMLAQANQANQGVLSLLQ